MASPETGTIAEMTRRIKAQAILNEFLVKGTDSIRRGDLDQAAVDVEEARLEFRRYGIDVVEFLRSQEESLMYDQLVADLLIILALLGFLIGVIAMNLPEKEEVESDTEVFFPQDDDWN